MASEAVTCTRRCGGNVKPYRFVKADTVAYSVLQATDGSGSAGDVVFGISDKGTWLAPLGVPNGTTLDDGYVGTTVSPPITVFLSGAECFILSGAAVAVNDYLKADSDGRGITASTTADNIGALALEPASAANKLIKCRVITGTRAA
jgi:hypothetical protein